jgi:hypothetical protein
MVVCLHNAGILQHLLASIVKSHLATLRANGSIYPQIAMAPLNYRRVMRNATTTKRKCQPVFRTGSGFVLC